MSNQSFIHKISAYVWASMLVVAGGTLVLVAVAGSTGGGPATVVAESPKLTTITSADHVGNAGDLLAAKKRVGGGVTPVNATD